MAPQSLEKRVESLEEQVTRLDEMPARMDRLESQIVQFRTEVRDEFSAVREDLRKEIRSGDEETRRFMRVLFEDYISRLRVIDEGRGPKPS
jgi:dsDNA-specific endonuclease/ATPase MutS2